MTAAELKTLRESLGLTLKWVADQAGVKLRTAQYWEQGENQVPADVAEMLKNVNNQLWAMVEQTSETIKEAIKEHGSPAQIDLVRYRTDADLWRFQPEFSPLPATCHGMLLSRIMREIDFLPVRIIYMQPENYEAWLNGRKDSSELRARWASEQP